MWVQALLCCLSIAHAAAPWPADADWQPLVLGGAPIEDIADDHVGAANDAADLLGTSPAPALLWDATDDTLFLRLQVASSAELVGQDFGWLLETDGVDTNFEHTLLVQGFTHVLVGFLNATGADGVSVTGITPTDFNGYGDAISGETRTVFDTGRFYVDAQLSREILQTDFGIDDDTVIRVAGVTAVTWTLGWEDVAACDGPLSAKLCTVLSDVLSDEISLDADGDGLTEPEEIRLGTDPEDADTDDDAVRDADDLDPLLCDADADGLSDGTELGIDLADPDTDPKGCFVADVDPSTTTQPDAADSDGGGLLDGLEDANHDGAIGPWETDPNDPSDDDDSDGDGIPDVFDDQWGAGDDVDSDGDGLTDSEEGLVDTDGDGVPDFGDLDSDDDGLPDGRDGLVDTDADGIPDFRDTDSDDDGLSDGFEGDLDTDKDGTPDFQDLDSDDDGIDDQDEGDVDSDEDGTPDFQDLDSDDDGIPDADEGAGDTDGDEIPDYLDLDSDDDGFEDFVEGVADTDSDGTPDFQDLDSDDDGIDDRNEIDGDSDCDGLDDRLDDNPEDGFCDTGLTTPPTGPGTPGTPTARGEVDPFSQPGQFTGGACSTAPGAAGLLPLLLLLLIVTPARAQSVNAQRFSPSVDGGPLVHVEEATVGPSGSGGAALWLGYASDPFVWRPDDPELDEVAILGAVATAHATGHYIFGPLRLGAELPLHLYTDGFGVETPTHMGDVRLSSKVGSASERAAAFGLLLDATLPTGDPEAWVGAGVARVDGAAIATATFGPATTSANLGLRSGTGQNVGDLTVNPALRWALGTAVSVTDAAQIGLELDGETWFGNAGQGGAGPVEVLLSGRQRAGGLGTAVLGIGTGLSEGLGAPELRLVAGLLWEPGDSSSDKVASVEGVEANPPEPLGRLVVRVLGPDGQPIEGAQLRIPGVFGAAVGSGIDGIVEVQAAHGEYDLVATAPGFRTLTRSVALQAGSLHDVTLSLFPDKVVIDEEAGRIYLKDKVFFEVGVAELRVDSLRTLDELAEVLLGNESVARLRIVGHTDTTGIEGENVALSMDRAEAVRHYLAGQGVATNRMEATGLGEAFPLQQGDSDDVHATNRRVDFHIVDAP